MTPRRIRLSRVPGWRKPADVVVVSRPSKFGNPFTVADCLEHGYADTEAEARIVVVDTHRLWLAGDPDMDDIYWAGKHCYDRTWVLANLHMLTGRDLACWCPPGPCHADALIALANRVAVTP